MEYSEFKGKTAVATGGASGMGLLFLQKMAENGANVVLLDVNEEAVLAAAEDIRQKGGNAIGIKVDVRFYSEIEQAVKIALEKFGRIDYWLNSAGGCPHRIWQSGPFLEADPEVIAWGVDVNIRGAVLAVRAVLKNMIEQGSGVIINMGSVEGLGGSGSPAYSASKAGVIGLTNCISNMAAGSGVRSVCIAPGPVLTRPAMANMKTPVGYAAEPAEVVDLIMFVCSDKGRSITGCTYNIDGGRSCAAMKGGK